MVKVKPKGEPAPGTEAAEKAKKAPAKKAAAKKAPAKQAGDLTREAMAEPKEGDRRHDEVAGIDVVFHAGKWIPAAGQTWGGGAMTSEQASESDKMPVGGWGTAADADADVGETPPDAAAPNESDAPPETIGWGLDGKEQIVDEEGGDASEAGKVKRAQAKKAPAKEETEDEGVNLTGMSKDLIGFIERAERVIEERRVLGDDLKEIIAEAKQQGYSTKIIRKVLSRRAMDPEKRKEEDALLDLYEEAINGIEKS